MTNNCFFCYACGHVSKHIIKATKGNDKRKQCVIRFCICPHCSLSKKSSRLFHFCCHSMMFLLYNLLVILVILNYIAHNVHNKTTPTRFETWMNAAVFCFCQQWFLLLILLLLLLLIIFDTTMSLFFLINFFSIFVCFCFFWFFHLRCLDVWNNCFDGVDNCDDV